MTDLASFYDTKTTFEIQVMHTQTLALLRILYYASIIYASLTLIPFIFKQADPLFARGMVAFYVNITIYSS
jgi:hypothetical protein